MDRQHRKGLTFMGKCSGVLLAASLLGLHYQPTSVSAQIDDTQIAAYLNGDNVSRFDHKADLIKDEDLQVVIQAALDGVTDQWQANSVADIQKEIHSQAAAGLKAYVVQWGDTLPNIAQAANISLNDLLQANKLDDEAELVTGDILLKVLPDITDSQTSEMAPRTENGQAIVVVTTTSQAPHVTDQITTTVVVEPTTTLASAPTTTVAVEPTTTSAPDTTTVAVEPTTTSAPDTTTVAVEPTTTSAPDTTTETPAPTTTSVPDTTTETPAPTTTSAPDTTTEAPVPTTTSAPDTTTVAVEPTTTSAPDTTTETPAPTTTSVPDTTTETPAPTTTSAPDTTTEAPVPTTTSAPDTTTEARVFDLYKPAPRSYKDETLPPVFATVEDMMKYAQDNKINNFGYNYVTDEDGTAKDFQITVRKYDLFNETETKQIQDLIRQGIFEATNKLRAKNNIATIERSELMDQMAQERADQLHELGKLDAHAGFRDKLDTYRQENPETFTNPNSNSGKSVGENQSKTMYSDTLTLYQIAENIVNGYYLDFNYGDGTRGHRQNMLDPNHGEGGFGLRLLQGENGTYLLSNENYLEAENKTTDPAIIAEYDKENHLPAAKPTDSYETYLDQSEGVIINGKEFTDEEIAKEKAQVEKEAAIIDGQ